METKGIDLSKCNNLRYEAKIDGTTETGRIVAKEGKSVFLRNENGYNVAFLTSNGLKDMFANSVEYFEIIPRDPETYMDWQVGDAIKNPDAVCYTGRVIFVSGDFVAIETDNRCVCYTRDELFNEGYRLVLTDIENQIIGERKKAEWEPQDGDVCYAENRDGYCTPFIYRHTGLNRTAFYAAFDKWGNVLIYHGNAISKATMKMLRPATEEERQRLFDAMAKEGKRWNAERKVVEDIPKPYEFKKGEPVLVRDDKRKVWVIRSFLTSNPDLPIYEAMDGIFMEQWKYCLPYNERTMHLLGTTEDYKEQ